MDKIIASRILPKQLAEAKKPIKKSPVWEQPIEQVPFANYQEYLPTETNDFDWNLVPSFNDYAKRHLPEHVSYINIYNMTVLRQDGHVGFGDCLHYYYPGPVDWWVHLWYSSLKDMAAAAAAAAPETIHYVGSRSLGSVELKIFNVPTSFLKQLYLMGFVI